MKKTMLGLSTLLLSFAAQADTVNITFVQDVVTPAQTKAIVAKGSYPFKGTQEIVFKIGGKTCTYVGSAKAIGPKGCNYSLTVNTSTNTLSDSSADNNPGCTDPKEMLANCK